MTPTLASRTAALIDARRGEPVTVSELASASGYTAAHFSRLFAREVGASPARFLAAVRIEQAKLRLRSGSDSVLRVCHEVGYSSLGTFTRRFAELVGVTPGAYRALSLGRVPSDDAPFVRGPRARRWRVGRHGAARGAAS